MRRNKSSLAPLLLWPLGCAVAGVALQVFLMPLYAAAPENLTAWLLAKLVGNQLPLGVLMGLLPIFLYREKKLYLDRQQCFVAAMAVLACLVVHRFVDRDAQNTASPPFFFAGLLLGGSWRRKGMNALFPLRSRAARLLACALLCTLAGVLAHLFGGPNRPVAAGATLVSLFLCGWLPQVQHPPIVDKKALRTAMAVMAVLAMASLAALLTCPSLQDLSYTLRMLVYLPLHYAAAYCLGLYVQYYLAVHAQEPEKLLGQHHTSRLTAGARLFTRILRQKYAR